MNEIEAKGNMPNTIKEIAQKLGCSSDNAYTLLRTGKLKGIKVNSHWLVTDKAIQEYKGRKKYARDGVYTLRPGQTYGYWTVVDPGPVIGQNGSRKVLCRCICGKECLVEKYSLIHGKTRSCGCMRTRNTADTITRKQVIEFNKISYEKGYKDAQLAILKAYSKKHDVLYKSDVEELSEILGLSVDEVKKQLDANYDKEKQDVYAKVSKQATNEKDLIYLLWKNGFVLEDFEKYGFSAETVWNVVMEGK